MSLGFRRGRDGKDMRLLMLGGMALFLGLCLLAACGKAATRDPAVQTAAKSRAETAPHSGASCKHDSECPAGQRCGFTGAAGCGGSGTCVVAVAGGSCFDPGGRCGCNGQPVELFCAKESSTEFASAPVNSVVPCPRPCTLDAGCPSQLVCRKGLCVPPPRGPSD